MRLSKKSNMKFSAAVYGAVKKVFCRLFLQRLLKQQMEIANVRDGYRNVIWHLKELKAYPDGKEEAEKLAAYWYEHHKNRPAMKDELKKAGYR